VEQIRNVDPRLRVVLLLDRPDPRLVVEAMRAGARGVFSRSPFEAAALCKCVRRVYEGQIWINTSELEYLVTAFAQTPRLRVVDSTGSNLLSNREEEVMRLVAEGWGNREIARKLGLSEHTIKNYLFRVFDKLGISNRVELVLYAITNPKKTSPSEQITDTAVPGKGRLNMPSVAPIGDSFPEPATTEESVPALAQRAACSRR
jgi:DNA-binding NarL/FixJ family response regulator